MKSYKLNRMGIRLLLLWLAIVTVAHRGLCDVPKIVTFQGKLTDVQGHVLDGSYTLTFRIYAQPTGGGVLWQEVQAGTGVTKGIFAAPLGAVNTLTLPFDVPYWVSIQVGTDTEMTPRQMLTSSPYALRAGNATLADTATTAANATNATHATTADNLTTPVVGLPSGVVLPLAGATAPTGFFPCDGRALSSISYPQLYAAIGHAWGTGDGTIDSQGRATDFRIPDLRGEFLRGIDGGKGLDPDAATRLASAPGGNAGNSVGSVQQDQFKSHTHDLPQQANKYSGFVTVIQYYNTGASNDSGVATLAAGGSETRPVNAYVNYIIKY